MADKHFVFDSDAFTDESVALNLAVFADESVFLYFDERSDFGSVVDVTAVEVDEVVENDIFSKLNIFGYFLHY